MGTVRKAMSCVGNWRKSALRACRNRRISCGWLATELYKVGERRLGTTILWMVEGGKFLILEATSAMNFLKGA